MAIQKPSTANIQLDLRDHLGRTKFRTYLEAIWRRKGCLAPLAINAWGGDNAGRFSLLIGRRNIRLEFDRKQSIKVNADFRLEP